MKENGFLKFLCGLSFTLVIIGGINWGFVGFFDFDIVKYLFGEYGLITRIIYILVGLSAISATIFLISHLREEKY